MEQSVHPHGPNTNATGSQKFAGKGIQRETTERREKLENNKTQNSRVEGQFDTAKTSSSQSKSQLSCLYMNARSIIDKFDEFMAVIVRYDPDVVGVTKSWASDKILDAKLSVPGYDMFRQDRRKNRGGGDLLYVKSHLKAAEFTTSDFSEQVHMVSPSKLP